MPGQGSLELWHKTDCQWKGQTGAATTRQAPALRIQRACREVPVTLTPAWMCLLGMPQAPWQNETQKQGNVGLVQQMNARGCGGWHPPSPPPLGPLPVKESCFRRALERASCTLSVKDCQASEIQERGRRSEGLDNGCPSLPSQSEGAHRHTWASYRGRGRGGVTS